MNDTERPVIINGVPVYDTDNYVPGQKISKTKRKNAIKSITNIPKTIGNITPVENYEKSNYKPSSFTRESLPHNTTDKKYGTISMICGILSLFCITSVIFSVPLGIIAIKSAKQATDPKEMTYAKIGRTTGIIAITITIIMLIATMGTSIYQELLQ